MISLTPELDAFAAKQSKVQEDLERTLSGSARVALRKWGQKDWFKALLERGEKALRARYRLETGKPTSPAVRMAVVQFRRHAERVMKKTTKPTEATLYRQAKSIAASLSVSAINLAVIAAAKTDERTSLDKIWLSMEDEAVRPSHAAAHGQRVPYLRLFEVGGHKMAAPGDLRAPIEEWINCRCLIAVVPAGEEALVASAAKKNDGVGIFLIPAADDPINELSTEDVAHVTTVWMGTLDEQEFAPGDIMADISAEVAQMQPFEVEVKGRDTLGDEDADVLFLNRDQLLPVRDALLSHETIQRAMDAVEQYPEWQPHLTLGYPDTPTTAKDDDLPATIRFDRVGFWYGDSHHEYVMGEAMETDEVVETEDWSEFEDSEPVEVPVEPIPWYGPLAPEGVRSGDGRKFAEGALSWRDLPLPFSWQRVNEQGHDGSVVVGNIREIWRHNGLVWGAGLLLPEVPETDEFVTLIVNEAIRGISVDADDATMEFEMRDGGSVDDALDAAGPDGGVDVEDIVSVFTSARICGATGCAIPAFQEAFIALGYPTEDVLPTPEEMPEVEGEEEEFREISPEQREKDAKEGKALPDGSFPIENVEDLENAIQSIGRASDPEKAKAHIRKRARELGREDLIPDQWSLQAAAWFVKTEDGPGWLTHPVDTDRLRDYWVRGPGAAKINWGVPGDFNRCRANLAKYVKPQHLAGYCANRHYDALGFWPGRPVSAETKQFSEEEMTPMLHLVAAAKTQIMPASWFRDPLLPGPTALSVTEEGQVFGHVATWGTCHIGIAGTCVTPPHSKTDYAYFHTGSVLTDEGEIAVGHLTVGTGHADPDASALVAMAHYDNTGAAAADVIAGEDEWGIWVAGGVRPHATPEQVYDLRASALSGDWRLIGSNLELVAALSVNVGGFPIPRMALAASGGVQTSLVASGIVMPVVASQHERQMSVEEIVDLALQRQEQRLAKRRLERLARQTGRDPGSRMKRLAAAYKGD